MSDDTMTVLIVTSDRKGVRTISARVPHVKFFIVVFLVLTALLGIALGMSYTFYRKAKLFAAEKERAVAKLTELSGNFIIDEETSHRLNDKFKRVEEKLFELQRILQEKGIKQDLPIGGEFIPLNRLSISYAEFLEDNLAKLADAYRFTPLGAPVDGRITSGYGYRKDPFTNRMAFHTGVDIKARRGDSVRATAGGVVRHAGWYRGTGKTVIIEHKGGFKTLYGHLSRIKVIRGQSVGTGDVIGLAGSTGRATGSHLHYEVMKGERKVNPKRFMGLM